MPYEVINCGNLGVVNNYQSLFNEKISKIADKIDEAAEFEYDASGKIVSAGLVDAHVHMRGINKEFVIHAELSSIPFGVTAAADACGARGDKALLDTFLLKNVIFVNC